ncbi:MAG: transposase [Rhodothermales bacterium]
MEWLWLYAAVEPATGESFCLYLPHLDGVCFEAFLGEVRRAYPGDEIVLVLERAGAHISGAVAWPEEMMPFYLPPRSPELDPAERWFQELRGSLSNVAHATLEEMADALTTALRPWWEDVRRLARLVGYSWWTAATGSILTSSHRIRITVVCCHRQ